MSSQSANLRSRHGFTLLELLTVIAVIATLTSITLLVMNGITDNALREATKTTVQKINGLLQQRIESFDRAFKNKRREAAIRNVRVVLENEISGAIGAPVSLEDESAVGILAKKYEFRFQFPQRVQDRIDAKLYVPEFDNVIYRDPSENVAPGLPTSLYENIAFPVARTQLITETGGNPSPSEVNVRVNANWANHDRSTESAELLYFALLRSENFGSSVASADQFSSTEITDTDNDGLPEFVDAWGNPLQFYRWPTRLVDPDSPFPFQPVWSEQNDLTETREVTSDERRVASHLLKGLPPAPGTVSEVTQREYLLVDPDDPIGLLYTFLENPVYSNMGVNLVNYINEDSFHTVDTYHTPLIVSAGVDGITGLYEPWRTDTGIYGTLAQPDGTNFDSGIILPAPEVEDAMLDNITNRRRRAGGRR